MSTHPTSKRAAEQQVNNFERKYGSTLLSLTSHAAIPVALNASFLHLLRINFFFDSPAALPYTAEADILLSSLCQDLDDDLYEIDPLVRHILLQRLARTYGESRLKEVALLLWHYNERYTPWSDRPELEKAQQLTALHFLDPFRAKQWLSQQEPSNTILSIGPRAWYVAMKQKIQDLEESVASAPATERSPQQYPLKSLAGRKIFIVGRPGSGKTTAARFMIEFAKRRSIQFSFIKDYGILYGMFQNDVEQRQFRPAGYDQFEVIDYAVFDSALRLLEDAAHEIAMDSDGLLIIQFTSRNYPEAFRIFTPSFLKNAYVFCVQTDMEQCIQRLHNRDTDPSQSSPYFVSDYIMRRDYSEDNLNKLLNLNNLFGEDRVKVFYCDNSGTLQKLYESIHTFLDRITE